VRGKGTKLCEGCPKIRLSQDRMPILGEGEGTKRGKGSKLGEGAFWDFGICVYVRDYYEFRACYIWDCYVRENYVAPPLL
jgi:hypothetical protein